MKDESITEEESKQDLLDLLEVAHYNAALNNQGNISASVAMHVFDGSGDPLKAISAAINSMGQKHAPLTHARSLVKNWILDPNRTRKYIEGLVEVNQKIPGFGNSFFKDQVDPSFQDVLSEYLQLYKDANTEPLLGIARYVNFLLTERKGREINLMPNAAGITGAIAEFCNIGTFQEVTIALKGRIPAWMQLISNI